MLATPYPWEHGSMIVTDTVMCFPSCCRSHHGQWKIEGGISNGLGSC